MKGKRNEKIICMILCMAMILSILTIPANADSSAQSDSACGKLYDENGNLVATIVGERVDVPSICMRATDEKSVTYRFDVMSSTIDHTDSASKQDAYRCVTAYLTLNYREREDEPSVYLLTNVSGSWTQPNDSRVSVTEGTLFYECIGFGPDDLYSGEQKGTYNVNVNTRTFNVNTGFSDYIVAGGVSCMGASLTLSLLMGTSRTWTLYLEKFPVFDVDIDLGIV